MPIEGGGGGRIGIRVEPGMVRTWTLYPSTLD
jgi:hypothetical protein